MEAQGFADCSGLLSIDMYSIEPSPAHPKDEYAALANALSRRSIEATPGSWARDAEKE